MSHFAKTIKKLINEILDEERITNKSAAEEVKNRRNFIGSHTFGEDIGGLEKMYVAFSYGTQHPLYLWDGETGIWYYNHNDYILPDGTPNIWTRKHLQQLRPTVEIQGRPNSFLKEKIHEFKKKHGIEDLEHDHTDLVPGEK